MEQIYYAIAAIVYGIFILRFILSWIGGDFELDADADFDLGDVVSFKGATHFLMGLTGWLSAKSLITHDVQWYDYLIGFVVGIVMIIVLFYAYKLMMNLETKPQVLSGKDLIGHEGKVYLVVNSNEYVITVNNGVGTQEYPAKSNNIHKVGDSVVISDFINAYYII